MLLRDQDLDLEELDYDAIQLEMNKDISTNQVQEDIVTLDINSHDSNETNQSNVATENASKGPQNNTDTSRKSNVKQETNPSEEKKQYLSDSEKYENVPGFYSDAPHGFGENFEFNNRHRIRTPGFYNNNAKQSKCLYHVQSTSFRI